MERNELQSNGNGNETTSDKKVMGYASNTSLRPIINVHSEEKPQRTFEREFKVLGTA